MNCVKCGGATSVTDTEKFSMFVWRKRRCLKCRHVMFTHENFVESAQTSRLRKNVIEKPKPASKKAEVKPLPIRNARKQIENIKEYIEYAKSADEDTDDRC